MRRRALTDAAVSLAALALALLAGAVFVLIAHKSPLRAYVSLYYGAFGTFDHLAETLNRTAPLILTGLSVAFAFRGGLFNIGGEGQYLLGGFASVWAGFAIKGLPLFIHLPIALLCGALAGALYGAIPAILKAKCGVHEVISTIMLNWIARYFISYLVNHVYLDPESRSGTPAVALSAVPPLLWGDTARAGILIAIACAVLIWFLLYRTTLGYEVKAVGHSPLAAEYGGIGITRTMVVTFAISGALAGLAGAIDYPSISAGDVAGGRFPASVDFRGLGFDGIAVALIGRNSPFGVTLAALLFGALHAGSSMMQLRADVPKEITQIIEACIILLMVAPSAVQSLAFWNRPKKPAQDTRLSGMHLPPPAPPASLEDPGGAPL